MKTPLDIQFTGMRPSESVEAKVHQRIQRLERFSRRLLRCEVWIRAEHGHHRKGPFYGVRIRLTVPGREILADFQPPQEDVYVAVREAFDAVRRELEDFERLRPRRAGGHETFRRRPRRRARSGDQTRETAAVPAEFSG